MRAFVTLYCALLLWTFHVAAQTVEDEFAAWEPEKEAEVVVLMEPETTGPGCADGCLNGVCQKTSGWLRIPVTVFFMLLAGYLMRKRKVEPWRSLFLLASLVILGFAVGGCPCLIKGFNGVLLWCSGGDTQLLPVVWLLTVLVLLFLTGPVFCGWICPLGALQEFVHRPEAAIKISERTNRIMVWIRRCVVVVLAVHLVLTRTEAWQMVDPFPDIFNVMVVTTMDWILVAVLLLTSLFIYRPFCRCFCPVGLVSGLLGRLRWVKKPVFQTNCSSCGRCEKKCPTGAVSVADRKVDIERCVACGRCLTACRTGGLSWGWSGGKTERDSNEN